MSTWTGPQHTQTSRSLVIVALVIGALIAGFWGLFMAGELLSDPGGWYGLFLVCVWVVPMLAVGALALLRPAWAAPLLSVLVGLWVLASVLTLVYAEAWRGFEDAHGPVGLIVMFALCVPLVALGRGRSLLAGVMLLVVTLVPVLAGVAWVVTGAELGGTLALAVVGCPSSRSACC